MEIGNWKLEIKPLISIIIQVKKINDYIRESVPKILELDYPDFEILIIPDKQDSSDRLSVVSDQNQKPKTENRKPKTKLRIIPSGKVGPAEKRDLAARRAKGDI